MYINLIKEKVHKNGDITFGFDVDNELKNIVLKKYGKKKYTKKLGTLFILEGLRNGLINDVDKLFEEAKILNKIGKEI